MCPFYNPAQNDMSQWALMYAFSEWVCNQLTHFHCKDDLQHSPASRRSCYSLNVYTSGCPLPLSSARGKSCCEIFVCTVHAIVIDNPKPMNADMDSVSTNTVIALLKAYGAVEYFELQYVNGGRQDCMVHTDYNRGRETNCLSTDLCCTCSAA